MDRRTCISLLSLALGFSLLLNGKPSANAEESFTHPGKVIEMGANQPLSVDIKAWPDSRQTGKEGDCPLYGTAPLDSTKSNQDDGQFRVKIGKSKTTYTNTYCASGYYPRADRDIPNKDDGSPVIPNPVEMYARDHNQKEYEAIVKNKTAAFLNDLAYLQSINPAGFDKVILTLASDAAEKSVLRRKFLLNIRELFLK